MSLHVFFKSLIPNGLQKDETEVTNFLVLCGTIFTIIQFIISIFQQAPYGRYAATSSKYLNWCPINSKLGIVSHKKSLITIFGHNHRIKNFHKQI